MSKTVSEKTEVWLIFQNDRLLIIRNPKVMEIPPAIKIANMKQQFIREHLLGQFDAVNIYCAELHPEHKIDTDYDLVPMRKALELLGDDWFTIASKAYSIINWDKNHQYCGRCATPTEHDSQSFERHCKQCELTFYPRISPSIIVLIQKGDQVLMARSYHFTPGIYGLIAGFVEAGENVEEAVYREINEEIGIRIKNLRYYRSQAWPFPDSLMLGFFAEYESGEISIDNDEIEDAGWYRYDNLPGRPSSKVSIASKLLDEFIATQHHQ